MHPNAIVMPMGKRFSDKSKGDNLGVWLDCRHVNMHPEKQTLNSRIQFLWCKQTSNCIPTSPYCKWTWLYDAFRRSCCGFTDSIFSRILSLFQTLASLFWIEGSSPPESDPNEKKNAAELRIEPASLNWQMDTLKPLNQDTLLVSSTNLRNKNKAWFL